MTYRQWLRECAELRRECEQRTEQEYIEQRIKEEAEGKTRRLYLGYPTPKVGRFAEPKAQELMECLAANAARWQVELQQLAADVDSEFLSENFVEFMQRPLLRFLAEKYPLRPGGILHALNLEFSEWTPTDESAQSFFFSQIPFGAWSLDDADMRMAWMEFLETWAGEDASPDSLWDMVLERLYEWHELARLPLHEAAVVGHKAGQHRLSPKASRPQHHSHPNECKLAEPAHRLAALPIYPTGVSLLSDSSGDSSPKLWTSFTTSREACLNS